MEDKEVDENGFYRFKKGRWKMKKTFDGYLFNRIEKIGNKNYNHVGCEGISGDCGDFLTQFVPEVGMRRKVRVTIESQ